MYSFKTVGAWVDADPIYLQPRQAYLLASLALARESRPREGFMSRLEIRRIPGWETATEASIGKKISALIGEGFPNGHSLIESRGPVTSGPYRLRLLPTLFSVEDDLRAELGRPLRRRYLSQKEEKHLYKFAVAMTDVETARGKQSRMDALRRAQHEAALPHHHALADILLAREYLGDNNSAEVLRIHASVKEHLTEYGGFSEWISGRLHEQRALIIYNRSTAEQRPVTLQEQARIRKQIENGLTLVGYDPHSVVTADLLNLLSMIEEEAGQAKSRVHSSDAPHSFEAAHQLILRGLDCAVFSQNSYAIAEAYFRLAAVQAAWADHCARWRLKQRGKSASRLILADRHLERALTYLDRCLDFRARTRSTDPHEPQLLKANIEFKLRRYKDAEATATAITESEKSHQQILSYAFELIADVRLEVGDQEGAVEALRRCKAVVSPENFELLREELRRMLT